MEEEIPTVIIDTGTYSIKAGYAGDDAPKTEFPPIIGYKENEFLRANNAPTVGYWTKKNPNLILSKPIERGIITDFDKMADIWHWTFSELSCPPQDCSVMLIEPILNPKVNREKMAQVMFEQFHIPALYIANHAVLAKYATGPITGLIVDSGESITNVVPVYEGHALPHAVQQLDLAGAELTNYLQQLLIRRDDVPGTLTTDIARDVKEKHCYVAFNYEQELNLAATSTTVERTYSAPNGNYTINDERFRCTEALFQPSLMGIESVGIHEAIFNAISKCDPRLHQQMFGNIALAGGNTLFLGLVDRLEKELRALVPAHMKVKVIAAPDRKYDAWVGGSILASLSFFKDRFITKSEYEESGPVIVHRKCY